MASLFFGAEIYAPWPSQWPVGRRLEEKERHLTLAFLRDPPLDLLKSILSDPPRPPLIGSRGQFENVLLLPNSNPRVVAWHATWWDEQLQMYQKRLTKWLSARHLTIEKKEWLSHVTLCRPPFNPEQWLSAFNPLPCYSGSIHLYESLGSSHYRPLWTAPVAHPFEEIEHTGDIAFRIRGETLESLYESAYLALAFQHPPLLSLRNSHETLPNLEAVIQNLNNLIAKADILFGSPFKAVSYHGEIESSANGLLEWEMIVDV